MRTLVVENLRKSFKGGEPVVRDVSFEVGAGEIFAFLGPNGAGKTTTIKMIAGLLQPDTGIVLVDGRDTLKIREASREVGAVLEGTRNTYWRLTTFENLYYFGIIKGLNRRRAKSRATALIERLGLAAKRDVLVQHLSRGMQQKLAIAVAIVAEPKLLLLDEPTLGLDVLSTRDVIRMIQGHAAEGLSIVLTTHQLDIAEKLASRIAIINHGSIVKLETRDSLLREFATTDVEILLAEPPDNALRDSLSQTPVANRLSERTITVPGSAEALYSVLELARPRAIESIGRRKVDLTTIFLKLTGEQIETSEDVAPAPFPPVTAAVAGRRTAG